MGVYKIFLIYYHSLLEKLLMCSNLHEPSIHSRKPVRVDTFCPVCGNCVDSSKTINAINNCAGKSISMSNACLIKPVRVVMFLRVNSLLVVMIVQLIP